MTLPRPLAPFACLLLSGCTLDGQSLTLPLLGVFALLGLVFLGFLLAALRRAARREPEARIWRPGWKQLATGAITDFGDTLGIGSFAVTTALFRFWKLVPDERIPGTLTVGHTLPTIVQALIFIQLVPVAPSTLLPMIAAAGLGAWLGTGTVTRLPRRQIRLGMGTALLVAAAIMLAKQLDFLPAGEDALGLSGMKLGIAIAANFVLGLIMPLGIGLYAPCMIVVSLLGMNPLAAFPIMMGSCAFLMPLSGARFCLSDAFDPRAAWAIVLAGVPAVLVAAYLVKSLPLDAVRWIVLAVVSYVAWGLLKAGWREAGEMPAVATGEIVR
ncbi:MAG: sulfite exporter TauE/SafE family protein [Gammaproteobacteria bacterium]|nr:sulfite exporter TauE/SafE family protein [Gammaproteobacteria bacterium]